MKKVSKIAIALTIFFSLFPLARTAAAQADDDPVTIGFYRNIRSEALNENRRILVYLPENYEKASVSYPVVYLLYGDRIAQYFAEAVHVVHVLGSDGIMPPMILVGIDEVDRYRDLLPLRDDGSPTGIDRFTRYLKEEVIPYVDRNFRTKDYRILVGPQAGANFGLYTLFTSPDLFGAYILDHPFRWRGGRDAMLEAAESHLSEAKTFNKFLFITSRTNDFLEKEGWPYLEKLEDIIERFKPRGFRYVNDFLESNDDFFSPTGLEPGLKELFNEYQIPADLKIGSLADLKAFYRGLSDSYGFEVDIPEFVLTQRCDKLLESGNLEKAMEMLLFTRDLHPDSANAYWRLANIYREQGKIEEAILYYKKAVELVPNFVPAMEWIKRLEKKR